MLDLAIAFFCGIRKSKSLALFFSAVMALGFLIPAYGQSVFNCSSFNTGSGSCGANGSNNLNGNNFRLNGPPTIVSSKVQLIGANNSHNAASINYTTPVNVQAFTATFQFIPSGDVEAFVLQNANNQPGYEGIEFYNGAGCEGGFYQNTLASESGTYINNIFAISLDGFNWLSPTTAGPNFNGFTTSTTNLYTSGYNPCHPNDGDPGWQSYASFATTPVQLNSPSTTPNTSTGDTYSVTITYDGSNVTESLYDVTAGGTCSPTTSGTCFTKTWTGINIPSIVSGNTAIVGFTGSTIAFSSNFPSGNPTPLTLSSFSYTEGSTTSPPPTVTTPTFSPAAGTYTSAQSVSISDATSGATIYYTTNGTTPTTSSAIYSGPITVSSSETLEAIAVKSGDTNSAVASTTYTINTAPPPTVAIPTIAPPAGTYTSPQSVTLSDATPGATIYYTLNGTTPTTSSTPYTGAIAVSSSETLEAIGVESGFTNSPVATATYTISPIAATPTFSPAAGTYTSAQTVTISDATSGATIYYTTNGTTPTTSSAVYSGPITVSSTETLEAIAVKSGDTNSAAASAAYTITPVTVATPTFSLAAGTYTSAQTVSISDTTSGATIYYTTNGTTPTTSSAVYSGPITVSSTETLEAVAVKSGDTNSAVASATYTITPVTVATPTFSPAAGTYTSAQTVSISDATSGATIYYTTNGTTPTTSSAIYSGPITVSSTETVKAIAAATGDSNSAVASATYTITPPTVSTPTFTPPAGAYTSAQTVSISDATSGATIYYTTDGTTPTTSSAAYSGPITVSSTETLEAIAVKSGDTNSAVASAAYTITATPPTVSTPTFTPPAGAYTSAQTVTIADATSGATIYYTTDGTTPTTSSAIYAGPITVSATETLEAIAVKSGDTNSAVASAAYTITLGPPPTTVSTPTFTPPAGAYTSAQTVTISDATSGATIYYTTDGTTPTTSSAVYAGPVTVSATETLEAIATAPGDIDSAVASAAYTITATPPTVSTPTFTPPAGAYTSVQTVTIADATSGATVYYTTNGTTPTTSSVVYSGPITVGATETLEAIAVKSGNTDSAVASAVYTITPPPTTVATPTFTPPAGTYTSAQSVTISDSTSGATIYYTTDGSTPTTSSTVYSGPITVSSSETLEAIAVDTGDTDSAVASAAYTITSSAPPPPPPTVSTPTFTPPAGTYTSAQTVSILDATSGATIYYTTNGTTPTTSSAAYSGPITVSSTETLKAIAAAPGDTNSAVAAATYTIGSSAPPPTVTTPTFTPPAGAYTSAQSVTIADATSGATIYYTTDGSTPTTSSAIYGGPITVSSTETLEAIAVDTGDSNSAVASAAYTINPVLPTLSTPTFTPPAGAYTSAQSVTISDATGDTTIYYTTDGTTPTTSSIQYTGPITVSSTETLEAIAADPGYENSAVASAAYTISGSAPPPTVSTPTFTPPAGGYTSAQTVTISDATAGATIYYTSDGTTPTASSAVYGGPITVSSTETLEAIAVDTDDTDSAVASAAYTITSALSPPTVSTPTFTPPAGAYTSAQTVSLSDASAGSTIYYTSDGTTPTTSSTRYTGPITVSSTETLEAIAAVTGGTSSAVASAAYSIPLHPDFVLSSSLSALTISSGGQATFTLTVTPVNGFDAPVTLACSGLPKGDACSFDQETIVPSGEAATSQLTISTGSQTSALQPGSRPIFPITVVAMTLGLFGWRKRRGMSQWLLPAIALASLGLLLGCGASVTGDTAATRHRFSSSKVTITATSGTLQQKATIQLMVN